MLEIITIGLFISILLFCVIFKISLPIALSCGFVIFFVYGLIKNHTAKEMILSAFKGVKTIKNIIIILSIIGILTSVWRMSGTIPSIIYYSTKIITPRLFIFITFILCCIISVLTGTAFGTAATIGVICMTMANTLGIDPFWTGGAILSGSFFGDRCSPMSTSALLVSQVTDTDIFKNIKNMIKTSIIPFSIASIIYLIVGFTMDINISETSNIADIFASSFNINLITIIPAAIIIVLSIFKVGVRHTMIISILAGALICFFVQGVELNEFFRNIVFGFKIDDGTLGPMLNGGGLVSMINVIIIISISSSYSGMFEKTNLLKSIKGNIAVLCDRVSPLGGMIITSIITSMVSCNQTLAIILTNQLCGDSYDDKYELSISLANSVVVIAPLVPWSIACTVPLTSVGAPISSIFAACYLYLLPISGFIVSQITTAYEKNDESQLSTKYVS